VSAVADLDAYAPASVLPEVQPEPIAPTYDPQPAHQASPEIVSPQPAEPVAEDGEKPAPRRSTVREKVSFGNASAPTPDAQAPIARPAPEPAPAAEPAASVDAQPRKAGWWSRRFGSSG